MPEVKVMSRVQVIRVFFFGPTEKAGAILAEIRQLSDADREELSAGAAAILGVEIKEV